MELGNVFAILVTYFIGGTGAIAAYSYQGNGAVASSPNYMLLAASIGFGLLGTFIVINCLASHIKSNHSCGQ